MRVDRTLMRRVRKLREKPWYDRANLLEDIRRWKLRLRHNAT